MHYITRILFRSYSAFSEKEALFALSKVKDFFVLIVIYLISGQEHTRGRNHGEYFLIISTNLKPQFKLLFYKEISYWIIYRISITNPLCILVFLTIHLFFLSKTSCCGNPSMVIDKKNSIQLIFWTRFKLSWQFTNLGVNNLYYLCLLFSPFDFCT